MNPYAPSQTQVASQPAVSTSTAVAQPNVPKQEKSEVLPEAPKKAILSDR